MSVEDALKQNKPKIDRELEKILPRKIGKAWVEWFLGRSAYDCDYETLTKSVSEPIWDFLDRGGKRWRPTLMLWSLEAVGGKPEQFYEFTAMPEFIHTGTIVADDLEDNSTERRGKPCMHLLYGLDIALNDSNIMYFLPAVLLYRNKKLSPGQKEKIYDLFAEEMMRVSIGQAMDIYWHRHQSVKVSEANYLQMCAYKTGVLARFSARLGAILGNASEKQVEALGKFGESLGVAFQIQDDILNLKPESGEWGKEVGDDIQEGKKTLLVIHALANAPREKAKRLAEILEKHSSGKKDIAEAIAIMDEAGSFAYAAKMALGIVEKSWAEAEKVLPESMAKGKLREFAFFAVKRKV